MTCKEYRFERFGLQIETPVEVGRAKGHFWFSSLHPVEGQDLLCEVVTAADKAQGKFPGVLCLSRDGGASWQRVREVDSCGPASIPLASRRLLLMPYELWPLSSGDGRNAVADGAILTCGQDGAIAAERVPVRFLDFPRDLADYYQGELFLLTNGNVLPLRDGRLFTTMYGKFSGDEKYTCFAVASEDSGFTWRYLSTVARWQDLPLLRGVLRGPGRLPALPEHLLHEPEGRRA